MCGISAFLEKEIQCSAKIFAILLLLSFFMLFGVVVVVVVVAAADVAVAVFHILYQRLLLKFAKIGICFFFLLVKMTTQVYGMYV